MKSLLIWISAIFLIPGWSSGQDLLLPANTPGKALEHYERLVSHAWNMDWPKFYTQLDGMGEAYPNLFMAHVQAVLGARHTGNKERFQSHLSQALECAEEKTEAEQIIFEAMLQLQEKADADLTAFWAQLIEKYPTTVESHRFRLMENIDHGRKEGNTRIIEEMIGIVPDEGSLYHLQGYDALDRKDYAAAEKAFDKYIELCPKLPNPYDSKGDYFMAVENYQQAAESYSLAYETDNTWTASLERAHAANALMDQQQAKEAGKKK